MKFTLRKYDSAVKQGTQITPTAVSEGIVVGKIVGWASIDSEVASTTENATVESQLTQIDTESFETNTEDGNSRELAPVISDDIDDEDTQLSFNDNDEGDETLCVSAEVVEDTDSNSMASDEADAGPSMGIVQACSSNQLAIQEEDHSPAELTKTERICQAIDNLKPSYHADSYGKYCDITDASDKVIRALILSVDRQELDFFAILEKLQEVVCRQDEIAAQNTGVLESPTLNSLIEFVGSLALNNMCE